MSCQRQNHSLSPLCGTPHTSGTSGQQWKCLVYAVGFLLWPFAAFVLVRLVDDFAFSPARPDWTLISCAAAFCFVLFSFCALCAAAFFFSCSRMCREHHRPIFFFCVTCVAGKKSRPEKSKSLSLFCIPLERFDSFFFSERWF